MRRIKHPFSRSSGIRPWRIYPVAVGGRPFEVVLNPEGEAWSVSQRFHRGRAVIWNSLYKSPPAEGDAALALEAARKLQKAEAAA